MTTNNTRESRLRCGNTKTTIRQNVSEKGPFFSTTFSQPFKDRLVLGATELRSVSITPKS